MEIKRCLKIRLYPTPDQLQQFIKTGGCSRFVYNKYVEAREQFYKDNIKGKSLTKEQKKEIYKYFKYKTEKQLIEVSKSGRCYCSICCVYESINDREKIYSDNDNQVVGLDFSPSNAYIDSNNNKAPNYVSFKQQAKRHLAHLQRDFSRTKKGSNNREKARKRLAKFEEHIANKRRDWMEKETLRLVRSFEVIGVETLNIKGMMKFSHNAKNYNDVSWYKFISMLEWKSKFHNCVVVKADKFFASSQLCNGCGFKNKEVKNLSVRNWICPQCGEIHNRDHNAAINLKKNALKEVNKIKSTVGTIGTYACGGQGSKARFNPSRVDCSLNQEERFVRTFIEAHVL